MGSKYLYGLIGICTRRKFVKTRIWDGENRRKSDQESQKNKRAEAKISNYIETKNIEKISARSFLDPGFRVPDGALHAWFYWNNGVF